MEFEKRAMTQELLSLRTVLCNRLITEVRTPLRNDSRTVEVRHPDRRKQTPLPLVRQLEKLAWGPACCQSPRRLFYSIMPLRFLMVSPSIRMI